MAHLEDGQKDKQFICRNTEKNIFVSTTVNTLLITPICYACYNITANVIL